MGKAGEKCIEHVRSGGCAEKNALKSCDTISRSCKISESYVHRKFSHAGIREENQFTLQGAGLKLMTASFFQEFSHDALGLKSKTTNNYNRSSSNWP